MRSRDQQQFDIKGLREACKEVVYPHVFENADREVGGVLVGATGSPGRLPIVLGAIEAIAADERRATLTFTQEAWAHVHRVMDEQFRHDKIVGWYHSHPSFGIFLSEHDLFIHRNFFSNPSQFALVIDPISGQEGIFLWEDGKITSTPTWLRDTPDWTATTREGSGSVVLRPRPTQSAPLPNEPQQQALSSVEVAVASVTAFAGAFAIGYFLFHSGS